jgi:putative methyltransferase (TIGR04325 family)
MNDVRKIFQTLKHKLIEVVFTSKFSSYLSPLIEFLVFLGVLKVWDGVYNTWENAPQDEDVLEEKIWINKVTTQANNAIAAYRSGENLSLASSTQDFIVSLAGMILLSSTDDDFRILDFGGGMAASYFPLISSVPNPERIEFHVVEVQAICNLGRKLLTEFSNLYFHEKLPELSKPTHIVHAGSSIQYIPDWKGLLSEFVNYRPELLILEDIPTGNIPTFVTTQNFYGKKVRSRFLNINELIEEVQSLDYELIYQTQCTQNFLGKIGGPLPMKNFPPQYQLKFGSHLIFRRMKP